jgi:hypothetical protein
LLRLTTAPSWLLLPAAAAFSAWRRRLLLLPDFTATAPGCAWLLPATTALSAGRRRLLPEFTATASGCARLLPATTALRAGLPRLTAAAALGVQLLPRLIAATTLGAGLLLWLATSATLGPRLLLATTALDSRLLFRLATAAFCTG